MPRAPRTEVEGGIHHLTTRGDHRVALFGSDVDRRTFLRRYADVVDRHGWVPLAYCLMGNHLHLVLETPECTLGLGARDLLGDFAKVHNKRRGESGHVFQGRFNNRLVRTDTYFAQLLRYVALNPVAAGLCGAPQQWPWSSHSALLAGRSSKLASTTRVEELLAVWGRPPGRRYAALFSEGNPLAMKYGLSDPWAWRPPLESLFDGASSSSAIAAAREHGYRLAEIAAHLGMHESTVSRRLRRSAASGECKKGA